MLVDVIVRTKMAIITNKAAEMVPIVKVMMVSVMMAYGIIIMIMV